MASQTSGCALASTPKTMIGNPRRSHKAPLKRAGRFSFFSLPKASRFHGTRKEPQKKLARHRRASFLHLDAGAAFLRFPVGHNFAYFFLFFDVAFFVTLFFVVAFLLERVDFFTALRLEDFL